MQSWAPPGIIGSMGEVHDIETGQRIRTPVFWRAVVGMNGSSASRRALRQAVAISIPAAAVVLVDVIAANGTPAPPPEVRSLAVEELEDASAMVAGRRTVLARVRTGRPAQVLLEESADADLVAVGAGRLGDPGETIHELVSGATCPVLIARSDRALPRLIAVDNDESPAARDVAAAVARRTGAQLTALVDTRADLIVVPADRLQEAWHRRSVSVVAVPDGH
jgi:nucleotide-binding universal stress UspA family protein